MKAAARRRSGSPCADLEPMEAAQRRTATAWAITRDLAPVRRNDARPQACRREKAVVTPLLPEGKNGAVRIR